MPQPLFQIKWFWVSFQLIVLQRKGQFYFKYLFQFSWNIVENQKSAPHTLIVNSPVVFFIFFFTDDTTLGRISLMQYDLDIYTYLLIVDYWLQWLGGQPFQTCGSDCLFLAVSTWLPLRYCSKWMRYIPGILCHCWQMLASINVKHGQPGTS